MSSSTYRYIALDSTYRNRTLYPNASDFALQVSTTGNATPPLQSSDPISLGFPLNTGMLAGVTNTTIVQIDGASLLNNFYYQDYLGITQAGVTEYRQITGYVGSTQTVTVSQPFSFLPVTGNNYTVRGQTPIISQDTLAAGSTQNILNLGVLAESANGSYNGQFIYFTSGSNAGEAIQIASYFVDAGLKQAILVRPLNAIPGTDTYDIIAFTRENSYPLIDPGTITLRQPLCYSVELLSLMIPNVAIQTGWGGTFKNYPYLLVSLYNEGNMHTGQTLYSNNPNAQTTLFAVPIGLNLSSEYWFNLRDAKTIQTVKLVLSQPIHFRITFPDGSPIVLIIPDNMSPQQPNPLLQFSATFAFRRVDH